MIFVPFISFIIVLRLVELAYASRNEKRLRALGAVEYGKGHYPFMILLHTSFFCSLIIEYILKDYPGYFASLIAIYFILLGFKVWVIASLGAYWNTKILRVPNAPLVASGPYKFLKHPNYVVVVFEIALIPLAFHLYVTAILFSILNAIMLYVRIREENRALKQ